MYGATVYKWGYNRISKHLSLNKATVIQYGTQYSTDRVHEKKYAYAYAMLHEKGRYEVRQLHSHVGIWHSSGPPIASFEV